MCCRFHTFKEKKKKRFTDSSSFSSPRCHRASYDFHSVKMADTHTEKEQNITRCRHVILNNRIIQFTWKHLNSSWNDYQVFRGFRRFCSRHKHQQSSSTWWIFFFFPFFFKKETDTNQPTVCLVVGRDATESRQPAGATNRDWKTQIAASHFSS